jgi:formiminoglutamate deiminase
MKSFWCESAVIGSEVRTGVRIEEAQGRIISVLLDARPSPGDIVLAGLVVPGMANAHSHAFHRALRGTTHADGGTFWNWRSAMYALSARLDPDNYRRLATAVFAEMVLAGFTLVGEFHYVHARPDGSPYDDADMEHSILGAAADAGIRITLLDTLYLRGGLDMRGTALPFAPEQQRFSDGSVAAWAARRARLAPTGTARIGAAVHSVRAVDPGDLSAFRAATAGGVVHAHVSEQPAENEQVLAATGLTPVGVLSEAGLVDEHFTAVHATHLSGDDVKALGDARAIACLCPTTERDLADGIGPAAALAAAGAGLAIGTDQHAMIDPFEEMRGVEMHERLATGSRGGFTPAALLESATSQGYRSLGWDGGVLAAGALCDLVALQTGSVRTAGASPGQLWLAATAADVSDVVVGGRRVVRAGTHAVGDVASLLRDAVCEVRA